MNTRRDWIVLKDKFIRGDWQTVTDFFKEQDIPNNSRSRIHTRNWKNEKLEYQSRIITQVQEKEMESVVEVRIRQVQAAKKMQEIGLQKLQELSPETADEARKLITSGLEQERAVLGMSDRGSGTNLTQVNVNLPRTKFDEMLDGKSFEELLEFIAAIRKEKERRRLLKNASE